MASLNKKLALSVAAAQEIEKLKEKKRKFNNKMNKKIKKLEDKKNG